LALKHQSVLKAQADIHIIILLKICKPKFMILLSPLVTRLFLVRDRDKEYSYKEYTSKKTFEANLRNFSLKGLPMVQYSGRNRICHLNIPSTAEACTT